MSTGDKDASLIGSSQWLGSFELSYILDAYLGITCKVGHGITRHAHYTLCTTAHVLYVA